MMKPVAILFVVSALMAAAPAQAQTPKPRPERPYRGLFGGGVGEAEQLLRLSASFAAGYDDDVIAAEQGGSGNPFSTSPASQYARASATLGYTLTRTKISFQGQTGAATSYVPGALQNYVTSYDGSAGTSIQITKRASFSAGQSFSRQPLYFYQPTFTRVFDLIFGEPVLYDQDRITIKQRRTMLHTSASFTYNLTRRMAANAQTGYESSETSEHVSDFHSRSMGAGLSYQLAKGLSLRGGYGMTTGEYDTLATEAPHEIRTQTFDGGITYSKGLSFSRKTTLSFATGTSALNDGNSTHFLLTGNVRLGREIGRSWNADAGYYREVSYSDVVHDPILSDSGTVGISGLISRRVQFTAGLGVSTGTAGFALSNNNFRTFYESVSLRFAIVRNLGVSAQYGRYHYKFDAGVSLTPGVPSRSDRQTMSVSLDFSEPLFYRARRGHASR